MSVRYCAKRKRIFTSMGKVNSSKFLSTKRRIIIIRYIEKSLVFLLIFFNRLNCEINLLTLQYISYLRYYFIYFTIGFQLFRHLIFFMFITASIVFNGFTLICVLYKFIIFSVTWTTRRRQTDEHYYTIQYIQFAGVYSLVFAILRACSPSIDRVFGLL